MTPERVLMLLALGGMTFGLANEEINFVMKVFIFIGTFLVLIIALLSDVGLLERWSGPPEGVEFVDP